MHLQRKKGRGMDESERRLVETLAHRVHFANEDKGSKESETQACSAIA